MEGFILYSSEDYKDIEAKIFAGERLTREDGLRLLACRDIAWLGSMADWQQGKLLSRAAAGAFAQRDRVADTVQC